MTTTPTSPTAREGVWVSPDGPRAEVVCEYGRWRSYVYMTRTGGTPTVIEHTDEAQLAEAIAQLEARGWQYDPDRRPDGPRSFSQAVAQQWSAGNVVGAMVVAVLIVVIGIALIG